MEAGGWPLDGQVVLIDDERSGSHRQNFQSFEELDNRSLLVRIQTGEGGLTGLSFAGVGQDGFPNRSEFSVVKMIGARTHIPQPLGEEISIPREERRRARRLVLIASRYHLMNFFRRLRTVSSVQSSYWASSRSWKRFEFA